MKYDSTAKMLDAKRGNPPRGQRWRFPGATYRTVGTIVRNAKVAANVKANHVAWYEKKFGRKPVEA